MVFAWLYPKLKDNMYDAKYLKTRHLVEAGWSVIDFYVKQVKSNGMTLEEAQAKAKEAIKNMRYEQKDYFWLNDMTPKMVMHPMKPKLDGKDLSNNKDPNGKRLFVEMVEVCKKDGAGFVDYYWAKPGETEPVPKISYVKLVPEWGWIIGSGIYIDDVQKELAQTFYVIFGVVAFIAIGGLLLSYLMARSIAKPINRISKGLKDGASQVASASGQISSSSESLAEGSSEQAASIEETSSSLEEISSMTRQNADNAKQADNFMKEASQVVENASDSMTQLTTSMVEISKASDETSKIIKTIDEIAFQTNLLALNAAVEAARAGEAGAGFAVVADEVRNLAMRAADAAKNTAELIEGTVGRIKDGSDLVSTTSEAFSEVAGSTAKVGELVSEIAAASDEQAQGIDQVNIAVAEMDKVVQQNAANAEESASASEEMNAQADEMKGMVTELVVLIDGKRNGAKDEPSLVNHGIIIKKDNRASSNVAHDKNAHGKALVAKKVKEAIPDQIIPMDDDFKNF
jgi:methyl-accepting chemotaxis protein